MGSEEENEESIPRPPLPPAAAHLAAVLAYQRNRGSTLLSGCPMGAVSGRSLYPFASS